MDPSFGKDQRIGGHDSGALRLALNAILVALICAVSTEIGFAIKFPPYYISPLWPTGAILFSVLVVAPIRHWWLYILAAYFTSVLRDASAGFPAAATLFIIAGIGEFLIAAVGVRQFANGIQAFESLRGKLIYILVAVLFAPFVSAFVAAFAGATGNYWFYWRSWFLAEALAYLTLAPAILTSIDAARSAQWNVSPARALEAGLIGCALVGICLRVFDWPLAGEGNIPALVYLPLPLLLWSAVRFGPLGANFSLLTITCLSIFGAVRGYGPFTTSSPAENVLALQLFLATISIPIMFLAALIQEGREKTRVLGESEARFRSLADSAPVLIWMSGPDKGCTYFSKGWLDFTGRTLAQDLGIGWTENVHPEDLVRCLAIYEIAFNARRAFSMEYRLRRHDGQFRWVWDRGIPRVAPDGAFFGYIGCVDDINERKRIEQALQTSESRYRALFENANDAIFLETEDDDIVEVNERACELLGYSREELLAMKVPDLQAPEVKGQVGTVIKDEMTKHREDPFEAVEIHRDGTRIPVEISNSAIEDNGRRLVLSIVRDVTQRHRAEEGLRQSQRELQSLSGQLLQAQETERRRIARELHDDLNQNLALLSVELDLLGQKQPGSLDQLRLSTQELSARVKQLSSVVHNLSHQLHPAKLEQLGLVAAIRGLCKELSQSYGLAIEFTPDEALPQIPIDVALCLYRIAQEALQNVVKHSGARRAELRLFVTEGRVGLQVTDDGTGFDPSVVNAKEGLGLVSMRERLRSLDGEIAIARGPMGGTQIDVKVPLAEITLAKGALKA
jgi:PAS domain S-box-containing protein